MGGLGMSTHGRRIAMLDRRDGGDEARAEMHQVTIPPERIQELRWPKECCRCGGVVPEPPPMQVQTKIAGWQSVSSNVCVKCNTRYEAWGCLSTIGAALGVLAFAGPVFLKMNSPQQIQGAGACFWLGCMLCWYADSRRKKAIPTGTRGRLGKSGELVLSFEDKGLCDRFCALNATTSVCVADPGSKRMAVWLVILGVLLLIVGSLRPLAVLAGRPAEGGFGLCVLLLCLGLLAVLVGVLRYRSVKRLSKPLTPGSGSPNGPCDPGSCDK
jgi:hypothetical protein